MTTHALSDTAVLTGRSLRHILRSPDTIVTTAIMPVAIMLLFVFVLGGAVDTDGIACTAYRVFLDVRGGIVDRLRSMPVAPASVLWGHVLTSLLANAVSLALVIGVALLVGFRSGASVGAWLAVVGILMAYTLAFTWVAVVAGLAAKTIDGASAFSYPLIFLPFVSSAFAPTDTMPGPVRWFAENQPVTSFVDAIRALLAQQPVGASVWVALAWCAGILAVAWIVAVARFRRSGR